MSRIVTATVKFLVEEDSEQDLMNTLVNYEDCWVNEDWLMTHRSKVWKDISKWDIGEVYSEASIDGNLH